MLIFAQPHTIRNLGFDKTEAQNEIDELNLLTEKEFSEKVVHEDETKILNKL
jgi:hypothetical protein